MTAGTRQTKRAWLGAGIIVLLFAVAVTIFVLEAIVQRLRPTYTVVAVLHDAPALVAGSRVWVSGRDVGEVREVSLVPPGGDSLARIAAVLELPTSVRQHVRGDSPLRVTSENLIGEPVIDIGVGSAASPALAAGDTLRQGERLDAAAVMARAANFRASLAEALAEMQALQAPVERRMAGFERVRLQLGQAQQEYALLMADVRASPTLALFTGGDGVGASLQQSQATLRELMGALQQVRSRAESTGAAGNARALAASARQLQQSLAELEAVMRAEGGTVDRLLRDSALVHAIAAARAELDSLIADAKRRPFRYVF